MIHQLLQTSTDYVYLFLRVVAGVIIFPYGAQKLLGWFNDFGGGVGIKASLTQFKKKKIPPLFAWMVILGQSLGSIALIIGFSGRIAAAGNIIIFTGALIQHLPDGWVLNWTGKKRGEGVEYFVLLLSILFIIAIKGSGPVSIDNWLLQRL
jgi:putative oxidoreductase